MFERLSVADFPTAPKEAIRFPGSGGFIYVILWVEDGEKYLSMWAKPEGYSDE